LGQALSLLQVSQILGQTLSLLQLTLQRLSQVWSHSVLQLAMHVVPHCFTQTWLQALSWQLLAQSRLHALSQPRTQVLLQSRPQCAAQTAMHPSPGSSLLLPLLLVPALAVWLLPPDERLPCQP
jgi:hypothetical protein